MDRSSKEDTDQMESQPKKDQDTHERNHQGYRSARNHPQKQTRLRTADQRSDIAGKIYERDTLMT